MLEHGFDRWLPLALFSLMRWRSFPGKEGLSTPQANSVERCIVASDGRHPSRIANGEAEFNHCVAHLHVPSLGCLFCSTWAEAESVSMEVCSPDTLIESLSVHVSEHDFRRSEEEVLQHTHFAILQKRRECA